MQRAPPRRPRPPTARVAPTAAPQPEPPDSLELAEFNRSPALRRRLQHKTDAASLAAAPAPRRRSVARGASLDADTSARAPAPLSDLDIQIAHSPAPPAPRAARAPAPPAPAPGRLICNTVDSWARRSHARDGGYKPLVFGGTYPIDEPASPRDSFRPPPAPLGDAHRRELRRTIERSLDEFEAILARRDAARDGRRRAFGRRTVETFDIDEPMGADSPPPVDATRGPDAKYYVAGPTTFDIDEPLPYS